MTGKICACLIQTLLFVPNTFNPQLVKVVSATVFRTGSMVSGLDGKMAAVSHTSPLALQDCLMNDLILIQTHSL